MKIINFQQVSNRSNTPRYTPFANVPTLAKLNFSLYGFNYKI
nr:MAG TPA: hypothetical protein [Inoviridae sp.]